jgi:hypothetical protein
MEKQKKELLKIFQNMSSDTRDLFLSYGRVAVVAEECMRRQYGLSPDGYPAQSGAKAKAAQQAEGAL